MFLRKHKDSISPFTLLRVAGIESLNSTGIARAKPEICRTNTRVHNKKNTPTQPNFKLLGTAAQQNNSPLPFCSAAPEEHFYPPYVILPLGIFPYSKRYFKDRVKATL